MEQSAVVEKLKNLPVKERIHAHFAKAAHDRGMKIQGLTERVILAWLDENVFFTSNIASGNIKKKKSKQAATI